MLAPVNPLGDKNRVGRRQILSPPPEDSRSRTGSVQEGTYGVWLLTTADQSRIRGLLESDDPNRKFLDPIASSLNLESRARCPKASTA